MEEMMTFTLVNDDGEEVQCEILFSFEDRTTGKNYMVYTDYSRDENGDFKVFASIYDPTGETNMLQPVQTDEEWAMVEQILENLQQDVLASDTEQDEELF